MPGVCRAECGVCRAAWKVENQQENPAPHGSFCPDCRAGKLTAPGVLNWKPELFKWEP